MASDVPPAGLVAQQEHHRLTVIDALKRDNCLVVLRAFVSVCAEVARDIEDDGNSTPAARTFIGAVRAAERDIVAHKPWNPAMSFQKQCECRAKGICTRKTEDDAWTASLSSPATFSALFLDTRSVSLVPLTHTIGTVRQLLLSTSLYGAGAAPSPRWVDALMYTSREGVELGGEIHPVVVPSARGDGLDASYVHAIAGDDHTLLHVLLEPSRLLAIARTPEDYTESIHAAAWHFCMSAHISVASAIVYLPPPPTDAAGHAACVCGRGYSGEFMLDCGQCHRWFHGSCVGVPRDRPPDRWVCDGCRLSTPAMVSAGFERVHEFPSYARFTRRDRRAR